MGWAHVKHAFYKALSATFLFLIMYQFYQSNFIKKNVEDIAFDIINKIAIKTNSVETRSPKVLLFGVDNVYMQKNSLYDENNHSNYGYLFPRDMLAAFIDRLDEFAKKIEPKHLPKALFVDYDMSFSSLPYGQRLSREDKDLLEALKRKHAYMILLPKTETYNFVEYSKDPVLQRKIKEGSIRFVSVSLKNGSDNVTRRYESYRKFPKGNVSKEYLSVAVLAWQILQDSNVSVEKMKQLFKKDDIIANRIWIKAYAPPIKEDGCIVQKSNWVNLTKYSASCSFYDIVEEEFAGSVVLLGGTHVENDDNFSVFDVFGSASLSGVDMHANALMTMLHLGSGMKRLSLAVSIMVTFIIFFMLSLLVSATFLLLKVYNNEIEFIVLLFVSAAVLMGISIYLLQEYKLWFNWFVPLILFEIVEIFDYIRDFTPRVISRIWRKK